MRQRLLKWLVCPTCRGKLRLAIAKFERIHILDDDLKKMELISPIENPDEVEIEIITGALLCNRCFVYYPIHNGIPRLLTYRTQVAQLHIQENKEWVNTHLKGYGLPDCTIPPGEEIVLKTFSREWIGYRWGGTSYWGMALPDRLKCIQYELGTSRHRLTHALILEVGIGIGAGTNALSLAEDCEVVGTDLGYSVDKAYYYFGKNPRFHIVQASLFASPFMPNTFDVVYSHGVLHHTHSTQEAFKKISKFPKEDQGMLYVWLYSYASDEKKISRRTLSFIEECFRPLLSKSPALIQDFLLSPVVLLYLLNQNFLRRICNKQEFAATYGWSEALHAARDRFTPFFARRHSYDEVKKWFEAEGFINLELLRDEVLPPGIPKNYVLNIGIRGFRNS